MTKNTILSFLVIAAAAASAVAFPAPEAVYADYAVKQSYVIPNPFPEAGDLFGTSVAGIGDIDGNGTPDIAVGAPGHHVLGAATGDVYIMLLGNDGAVMNTVEINAQTPNGPSNLEKGDLFGTSVAGIGDVDGNGTPDIAVGAPGHHTQDIATGDVYIMLLGNDGAVMNTVEINAQTPNGPSLGEGDLFGTSVAGIGDIDGNGTPDIAVGAPGHHARNDAIGDIFIIMLDGDGAVTGTAEIHAFTPNGPFLEPGDLFGTSVAGIGDIDGNGTPDIAAGAPNHHTLGVDSGDLYIMLLEDGGAVIDTAEIHAFTPNGPSNLEKGDLFGTSVAGIGDIDGNGTPDIAVGAPGHHIRGMAIGDLYIFSLDTDGTVRSTYEINAQTPNGPPLQDGDLFGTSVAGMGDIDGDGGTEVAAGAPGSESIHVVFASAPSTLLRGTVFEDGNGNGMQDAGEAGIPGLAVLYVSLADHSMTARTATDSSGTYAFAGIPAGGYLVQVEGTDLYRYLDIPGGQVTVVDFASPSDPSAEPKPDTARLLEMIEDLQAQVQEIVQRLEALEARR